MQSLNGEHNVVRVEDVVGVQLAGVQDLDVRQVVGAAASINVLAADDQKNVLAVGEALDEGLGLLGGRGLTRDELLDDVDALVTCTVRQCAVESSLDLRFGVRWE